jgi:hypothetical protein
MPITATVSQLPSGARCVRLECSGQITREDAEALSKQIGFDGPWFRIPILSLSQGAVSVSVEARHVFGQRRDLYAQANWTAVVVASPLMRVTANFLMRVNRMKKQRLFSTEAEAVQWLEERIKEDQVRVKAE